MNRVRLVAQNGIVFGLISGAFLLLVRMVSVVATNDITPTAFSDFVSSALGLLIIGGAGRKLAVQTKSTTLSWQMGAVAGAISEVIRTLLAAVILSYLPVGQVAFNRLSPAAQRQADDPATVLVSLTLDIALAVVFGGLIGWLGAWSTTLNTRRR